jgi:hypothetical protein
MRVDYTLPSIIPETVPELPASVDSAVSFRDQLRTPASAIEFNWQQHFHLDSRPANATYIGPPPRPKSMEVRNIDSERTRWRSMLVRHYNGTTRSTSSSPDQASVKVMLDMLIDMQGAEDEIVSQNASLTRG